MRVSQVPVGVKFYFSDESLYLYERVDPFDDFPCEAFVLCLNDGSLIHIYSDYEVKIFESSVQQSLF